VITHDLIQGSPEWLACRAQHFNASDAPAMMGCSPYKTRAELLREMHTGVAAAVDIGTQKRFDNGHRAEALARPLAEEFIGQELYPVTGSLGQLSASFDGLTLDESEGFEHKALNDTLRAAFDAMAGEQFEDNACRQLPIYHRVQMEQQLMVSGARRILFMTSAWADEELVEERHCWYYPDAALRQQIVDGWAQFERDMAAYTLPPATDAAPVGKAPETLPALRIEVTGAVTESNLAEFKATALGAIRSVNRNLVTDQDFADARKAIKWCEDVEDRIAAAKRHALSQTATIDELFRVLDDIAAESKTVRVDLTKLDARRSAERKDEIVVSARKALDDLIATLNAELAPIRLQAIAADFPGAIKGKRSIAAMQDALAGVVTAGKIAADTAARALRANIAAFQKDAAGFEFLFSDFGQVVHKGADDFALLVQARIGAHKAAEASKEQERQAAEAQRIAQAEQRAREQEAARIAAEQAAAAEAQRRQEAAAAEAQRQATAAVAQAAAPVPLPAVAVSQSASIVPQSAPVDAPQAASVPAPRADEPATLKLGTICERLGFTMTAQFVSERLGIAPKADGASKLFTERQFDAICERLVTRIRTVQAEQHAGVAA
jgi:putative phage-type endonuclease